MGKVVSLSVHKNTLAQRKSHALRKDLVAEARLSAQDRNICGYILVTWDSKLECRAKWHNDPKVVPFDCIPEFIKRTIERTVAIEDTKDWLK